MVDFTEKDDAILEKFPHYEKGGEFVGTREYWEGIFSSENNRDPELHKAFSELHEKLVNEIIQFCEKHDLRDITEVRLCVDGIEESIDYGKWECGTDSSMSFIVNKIDETTGWTVPDRKHPFLYEI